MLFILNGKIYLNPTEHDIHNSPKEYVSRTLGISHSNFYLLCNGKITNGENCSEKCMVHIVPRIFGGKGGFGSMLRAIGAQIEKTTNREACRDLSGRRLRDINEEKRLKKWINQQSEREKQAEDRRQKKLERLIQKPKHEFRDENYDKERTELPEKVEDALEQGLKASCSGVVKRKHIEDKTKKKKAKLWVGSEDELSSSIDSEDSGDEGSSSKETAMKNNDTGLINTGKAGSSSEESTIDIQCKVDCETVPDKYSSKENTNVECSTSHVNDSEEKSVQI